MLLESISCGLVYKWSVKWGAFCVVLGYFEFLANLFSAGLLDVLRGLSLIPECCEKFLSGGCEGEATHLSCWGALHRVHTTCCGCISVRASSSMLRVGDKGMFYRFD